MADGDIDVSVVVEIGGGDSTSEQIALEVVAAVCRDIGEPAGAVVGQQLGGHGTWRVVWTQDMAVGDEQVEIVVAVDVDGDGAEAQEGVAGCRNSRSSTFVVEGEPLLFRAGCRGGCRIGSEGESEVSVEGVLFLEVVSQEQVEAAIAVEVAAGDSHAGFVFAFGAMSRSADNGHVVVDGLLEVVRVGDRIEVIGCQVVADVDFGACVVIEIDGRHSQAFSGPRSWLSTS